MIHAAAAYAQEDGGHTGGSGKGHSGDSTHGQRGSSDQGKGGNSTTRGTPGKGLSGHVFEEDEGPSEDARGPQYGGGRESTGKPPGAGTKKGDIYGDLYVILRDPVTGMPVLNDAGFVQPIDKDGNLIPLDAEGAPLDETLLVAVELGRTSVSRAGAKVLDQRLTEAVNLINAADSVSLDQSGRLLLTTNGVSSAIDSPLENLALYKVVLSTGSIPGITDPSKLGALSYLADGKKTLDDVKAAVGLLAGATDKEDPLSLDEVEYLNRTLAITGTLVGSDGQTYVDYTAFSYDRQATYGSMTATVLIQTSPGIYESRVVNVYDTVFADKQVTASGAAGFAEASDDARDVLLYLHDNAPR